MDCNSSVSQALSCGNYFLISFLSNSEIRACFLGQGCGLFFSVKMITLPKADSLEQKNMKMSDDDNGLRVCIWRTEGR